MLLEKVRSEQVPFAEFLDATRDMLWPDKYKVREVRLEDVKSTITEGMHQCSKCRGR